MITLKHLIIFKEVARLKSMSKAAETLYISQPTISQKIQEIENYYHIKLFQRYSKHLGISEEGKLLLEHANKVLAQMDEIDETFFHHKESINIRLGFTLTVGSTFAAKIVRDIKTLEPNLHIHACVDNTQSVENKLLDNELDIGIVEGDIHNDNIICEEVIPDRLVLVCSKDHPLAGKKEIIQQDLHNLDFVCREKGSGTRASLEQFMSLFKIPYHVSWQCNSWESVKQGVLENHGLTLISIRLVEKEIEEGQLKVLHVKDWTWHRFLSLCYHKNITNKHHVDLIRSVALNYIYCPLLDSIKNKN